MKLNEKRRIQLKVWVVVVLLLMAVCSVASAQAKGKLQASIQSYGQMAKSGGHDTCLTTVLNRNLSEIMVEDMKTTSGDQMRGSIRAVIGGRNFTAADIDSAEVPFFTLSGMGGTQLLHDGGIWPGTGGNTDKDDGRSTAGVDQAGEIYDLDRNGHYPKAVLRYIGAHCYIFVPVMMYPTLPRGISATEDATPAAKSEWGMYWPDTQGWGQGVYYYTTATGAKTLEPRYVLGSDKNLARMKLKELADEFDGNIYSKVREYFGSEPDIDGDPKVFIMLDDIRDGQGTFRGYVWKANELPNSVYAKSNEKEIIHLDLFPTFLLNPKQGYRTMAHEFTHLIAFNEGDVVTGGDIDQEETWLEEGFTQYASHVYDKSHTSNVDEFIKTPDTPLTQWNDSVPFANYGASYLWIYYLMEHYGKNSPQTFMRGMVRDKAKGTVSMDNALKGFNTTFADTFADWAIANIVDKTRKLDGSALNDGKWGYFINNDYDSTNDMGVNERLPMKFSERVILSPTGAVRSAQVNSWAADYIEMTGNSGNVNLGFDGDDRSQFKVAAVKRGPQVDPAVEYFYLNDKQYGNLIIQNYGTGNTYENMILVPMVVSSSNNNQMNYVYSATFADLKVGMFPNPVFENELHIVVRTSEKFAAVPRLQMTYNGQQGYLTMVPVNESTYLCNYQVKMSGEGEVEAFGTTSNGTILQNRIKFSAVYYPPKSSGLLTASIGSINIPKGAIRTGGLVSLAAHQDWLSPVGLRAVTRLFDVGLPGGEKSDLPLTFKVPAELGKLASGATIGLFEWKSEKAVFLKAASIQGNQVQAEINRPATLFFAVDGDAPRVKTEPEPAGEEWISLAADDLGTGIDPLSLKVESQKGPVMARYDEKQKKVFIYTGNIPEGRYDFVVQMADKLGNQVQTRISAQVAGPLVLAESSVYPSPARAFTKLRTVLKGASFGKALVEVSVYDLSGDEVLSTYLNHQGNGLYETTWNLVNGNGKLVANGAYIAEFRASGDGPEIKVRRKFAVLR